MSSFNAAVDLLAPNLVPGRADRIAYVDDREQVSFAELEARSNRFGWMLHTLGVRPEERVFMVMLDTIDFVAVFLGAIKMGAVPVPVNTMLQPGDYVPMLADSRARLLVVSDVLAARLQRPDLPARRRRDHRPARRAADARGRVRHPRAPRRQRVQRRADAVRRLQTFHGPWTRTGDRYVRDGDGYYTHCGRADDMLKVGGIWVSPVEVESALVAHEAVLEAAVVGHPDADDLIKPRAFVVLRHGHSASPELAASLQTFVKSRLAPYKYPRWIEFVDALPRTATGKLQRFRLRA